MAEIALNTTVGQLVAEKPSRARVFEKYGIDYCCGGKIALEVVCSRKKVEPKEMLDAIAANDAVTHEDGTDWTQASMTDLVENIVSTHHAYLKEELPRLAPLVEKVARVHGENHAELPLVHQVFGTLRDELESHMWKEDNVLFPYIVGLESGKKPEASFGSVQGPILVMEHEHEVAGSALERLRSLNNDYTAPLDACNSYRAMLEGLETMEKDLHQHIHKENNILFPKAVAEDNRVQAAA